MAYRRRHGMSRASTFQEDAKRPPLDPLLTTSHSFSGLSPTDSVAGQPIPDTAPPGQTSPWAVDTDFGSPRSKRFNAYQNAENGPKGFWGVLARKAKAILDDDDPSQSQQLGTPTGRRRSGMHHSSNAPDQNEHQPEGFRKMDNPAIRKGLERISTSLNNIGDSFERAYEEGRNKTSEILQETRKIQTRRKENGPADAQDAVPQTAHPPGTQTNPETQLKASRDVAMATAAKAKLLLRELKTVKADLAFAKERCSQLEDENKMLRESREKGAYPTDDDLIRLQLETLLAEKARLAHDNEVFARENRFLREIIEYHQLTMQDVVYLDEGAEEVTEVYPLARVLSGSPLNPRSPPSPSDSETEGAPRSTNAPITDSFPKAEFAIQNVDGDIYITKKEDLESLSANAIKAAEQQASFTPNADAKRPSTVPDADTERPPTDFSADTKTSVPPDEDANRGAPVNNDATRPCAL